jgi:hypothetical protein
MKKMKLMSDSENTDFFDGCQGLMMEVAKTSETLVHFYQTAWCYNLKTSIFVLTTVRTSNPN